MLETLLGIPKRKDALVTRGGMYDPALNVWIADEFPVMVEESSAATRQFFDGMAGLAMAAGRVHLHQLQDAKAGRIWPAAWLHGQAGAEVIAFCEAYPEAASPYACLDVQGERVIPFTHQYQVELGAVGDELGKVLANWGADAAPLYPYLTKLQEAFRYDSGRTSDLEAMGRADIGWLEIADDARWLLIAEFTETYADPLKHHIGNDPAVNAWAKAVSQANGLGPWKTFLSLGCWS